MSERPKTPNNNPADDGIEKGNANNNTGANPDAAPDAGLPAQVANDNPPEVPGGEAVVETVAPEPVLPEDASDTAQTITHTTTHTVTTKTSKRTTTRKTPRKPSGPAKRKKSDKPDSLANNNADRIPPVAVAAAGIDAPASVPADAAKIIKPVDPEHASAPVETPAGTAANGPVEETSAVVPAQTAVEKVTAVETVAAPPVATPAETGQTTAEKTDAVAEDKPVAAPALVREADPDTTENNPAAAAPAAVTADTPWVDDPVKPNPPPGSPAAEMPAPPRHSRLSRIFNAGTGRHVVSFATGMGVSMAISGLTRTAVFSAATAAGVSSAPALIAAAATAGFVLGNYRFFKQRHDAVKAGSPVHEKGSKDFWKQYCKTVLTSTVLAGTGGAFAHYCMPSIMHFVSDKAGWVMDKIHDDLNHLFGPQSPDTTIVAPAGPVAVITPDHAMPDVQPVPDHAVPDIKPDVQPEVTHNPVPLTETAPEAHVDTAPLHADPVEPHVEMQPVQPIQPEPHVDVPPAVEQVIPVIPVEPSAADRLTEFAHTHHLSRSMQKLFDGALNGNAQAEKDIAYFLFNGFRGMPKDQGLAVVLFKHAASLGNVQAQVDDSYIQHWGLAHQAAQPAESLAKMQDLAHVDQRAARLSQAWEAAARHVHRIVKPAVGALSPQP